jgi:hypothetical protein
MPSAPIAPPDPSPPAHIRLARRLQRMVRAMPPHDVLFVTRFRRHSTLLEQV